MTSIGYCEIAQPIYISQVDLFTEGTARQLLSHNETWEAICEVKK